MKPGENEKERRGVRECPMGKEKGKSEPSPMAGKAKRCACQLLTKFGVEDSKTVGLRKRGVDQLIEGGGVQTERSRRRPGGGVRAVRTITKKQVDLSAGQLEEEKKGL